MGTEDLILQFGLPTTLLLGLAGWHIRTVLRKDKALADLATAKDTHYGTILKDKDQELTASLREKDDQIALKDAEIKRINEARITDAQGSADRMLSVATEFTKLTGETNQTLTVLAERMPKT